MLWASSLTVSAIPTSGWRDYCPKRHELWVRRLPTCLDCGALHITKACILEACGPTGAHKRGTQKGNKKGDKKRGKQKGKTKGAHKRGTQKGHTKGAHKGGTQKGLCGL